MKSKKSEIAMSSLVVLIIILLSAAAMGYIIYKITQSMAKSEDIETCRESVVLASTTRQISGDPMYDLKCERSELLLEKRDIVEDNVVNQEKLQKILLEEMKDCWYKFGEGKMDPFTSLDNLGTTYCLICKEIKFDDALTSYVNSFGPTNNPDYDMNKNSLLMPTSYNVLISGEDQTYYEYFEHLPKTFNGEEDITKWNILQDGSLLGLSGMKTENVGNYFFGLFEKEVYITQGLGNNRDLTVMFNLFLVAPLNLRNYGINGYQIDSSSDSVPLCKVIIN